MKRCSLDSNNLNFKILQKLIPGAKGQNHTIIKGGGHFVQDDKGEELAKLMIEFMKKT